VSGTRIIGIGIDLVEVTRFSAAIERHGTRFLARIFTDAEIEYCAGRAERLAARFAAKEAAAKAFGTGIGAAMGFREIEIVCSSDGRPRLEFHGTAASTASDRGVTVTFVSLTHTESFAAAQVLLCGDSAAA
jgi:holo-[acyl-carrier protein] synthase